MRKGRNWPTPPDVVAVAPHTWPLANRRICVHSCPCQRGATANAARPPKLASWKRTSGPTSGGGKNG